MKTTSMAPPKEPHPLKQSLHNNIDNENDGVPIFHRLKVYDGGDDGHEPPQANSSFR